jgi:hypothetical protein
MLNNTKETNSTIKLSHQQKMKKNPISWIIIICFCGIFLGVKLVPQFLDWRTKFNSIKESETKIVELENGNEILQSKLTKIEQEFNSIADEYREKEIKIFPSAINPNKIAEILELFALQMENLDSLWKDSHFEINKISIEKTTALKGRRYLETPSSIDFTSDETNIKKFFKFLQTQEIPQEFIIGVTDGRVDPTALQFLKDNLLPMMHIELVKISPETDKKDRFKVQLKIVFFSNIK